MLHGIDFYSRFTLISAIPRQWQVGTGGRHSSELTSPRKDFFFHHNHLAFMAFSFFFLYKMGIT